MRLLLRLIRRDPITFSLNMLGLAIGIGTFVLLQVFVSHERSFDEFHDNADQLHRITIYRGEGNKEYKSALVQGVWAQLLEEEAANIRLATKIMSVQSELTMRTDHAILSAPQGTGFYTDGDFLDLFRFPLRHGGGPGLLQKPNSLVLTRSMAMKLFGRENVIGETVSFQDDAAESLQVTAVLEDLPDNSHLQFDYLVAGATYPTFWKEQGELRDGSFTTYVYFETEKGVALPEIEASIEEIRSSHFNGYFDFPVQKVTDIHFGATALYEHTQPGNKLFVDMLAFVSFFVLLVAVVNYIILTASQLFFRAHEVSIRKTLGGSKGAIFSHLILEGALLSMVSGLLCIILVQVAVTEAFPKWFGIGLDLFEHPMSMGMILGLCLAVGLISAIIPAWRIVNDQVGPSLQRRQPVKRSRFEVSRLLIIQFAFAHIMLVGSLVIVKQMNFLNQMDLGFNRDAVINISRPTGTDEGAWRVFYQQVANLNFVGGTGYTQYDFIGDYSSHGLSVPVEGGDTTFLVVQWNYIDEGTLDAMEMELLEGRNFDPSRSSDAGAIILNEAAAKKLNAPALVGSMAFNGISEGGRGEVIGVVRDFHFQSFDKQIVPTAFFYHPDESWRRNLLVKMEGVDYQSHLEAVQDAWRTAGITTPFNYQFLDDWFQRLIVEELRLANLITAFSGAILLVTCLGLVGLVRFQMMRQRKNIGIRKVFGASIRGVLLWINRRFVWQLGIALVVGTPVALIGLSRWLDNFVYRADQTVWDYALGLGILVFFTCLVVTLQSWRTVSLNPADVLKDE